MRTDTAYIEQLATDCLEDAGWYVQAEAVVALAHERDALLKALEEAQRGLEAHLRVYASLRVIRDTFEDEVI